MSAKPSHHDQSLAARSNGLVSRRRMLQTSVGMAGLSMPALLRLQNQAQANMRAYRSGAGKAKSCIVLFCWGGISHFESWDPKPDAPVEIRGEFSPIQTSAPGVQVSEHLPLLAQQAEKLAIIRSIHHRSSAHGKGMYWNLTGHAPPQAEAAINLPPASDQWPSLAAMVSHFRKAREVCRERCDCRIR